MKKRGLAALVGMMFLTVPSTVGAVTDLPNTSTFYGIDAFKVVPNQELVWSSEGSELSLIDLKRGDILQTIPGNSRYYQDVFAISDDRSRIAVIRSYAIEIYNEFGEMVQQIESLKYNNTLIKEFTQVAFLPNSHKLVALTDKYGDAKLFGYDLDTSKIDFARSTSHFGEILVSDHQIAVINSNDAYIYNHEGMYETVIHPEVSGGIQAYDFSRDGLLVLGEADDRQLKVYDGANEFKKIQTPDQFVTDATREFNDIDIDESGKFIAATYDGSNGYFSLFERSSGRKIYTTLDKSYEVGYQAHVALTKDAKSIVLDMSNNRTGVFDGANIKKRPVAIKILNAYQEVTEGASETVYLEVTQADGKKVKVKDGVKWATNSPTKAYIKSGKLVGGKVGDYTLKASYEGFTATVSGKVVAPPKLSSLKDVPWLQRHRQGILSNKAFEGTVAPNSSYKKVSGTAGKFYVPKTSRVWNGKWKGSTLYSRYASYNGNGTDQIDMLAMLPSLEKRTLTKTEVKEAFGKATTAYTYKTPTTYYVDKSKKNFAKYTVKSASVYHLNGQELYIAFDKNDYVRFLALSPLD